MNGGEQKLLINDCFLKDSNFKQNTDGVLGLTAGLAQNLHHRQALAVRSGGAERPRWPTARTT